MMEALQSNLATLQAWLQTWVTADAGLWGLFASALLSATVLPGSSEVVMAGLVTAYPHLLWPAFAVALAGNLVGSALTFAMGWAGRQGYQQFQGVQHRVKLSRPGIEARLQRYGPPALVLAFLPLVGDALVLAAGWLRLPLLPSLLWIALGKGLRYAVLLAVLKGVLPGGA